MPKCLVVFCKNRRGESEGVNFYSLTEQRYKRWMKALGRDLIIDKVAVNCNAVCSEHFTENSFTYINNRKVLKHFAIPTLKLKPERYNSFHNECLKQAMTHVFCCVPYCNNKLPRKMFYHMPIDELLKKLWMVKIFGVVDNEYRNSFICSAHFKDDDFQEDNRSLAYGFPSKKILKQNAVPSVNLPNRNGNFAVLKTVVGKEHQRVHPMGVLIYKYSKPEHKVTSQEKIKDRIEERLKQRINILKADLKAEKEKCLILQRKMTELKSRAGELESAAADTIEEDLESTINQIFKESSSENQLDDILKSKNISKTHSSSSTSLL